MVVYSIRILNELHELYPDLLYQPSRFQSGADVINYIVEQSIHGPFQREYTRYEEEREQREQREELHQRIQRLREEQAEIDAHEAQEAQRIQEAQRAQRSSSAQLTTASIRLMPFSQRDSTQELERAIQNVILPPISSNPIPIPTSQTDSVNQLLTLLIEDGLYNVYSRPSPVSRRPTQEQLERTTTILALMENQDNVCTICHEGLLVEQNVRRINHCNHMFHQICIDTWFSSRSTCPTCRHDIRT
jgi:hypothetical protein